ncbi:unnamed protein product, partial [Iphiclides podalirius]
MGNEGETPKSTAAASICSAIQQPAAMREDKFTKLANTTVNRKTAQNEASCVTTGACSEPCFHMRCTATGCGE